MRKRWLVELDRGKFGSHIEVIEISTEDLESSASQRDFLRRLALDVDEPKLGILEYRDANRRDFKKASRAMSVDVQEIRRTVGELRRI